MYPELRISPDLESALPSLPLVTREEIRRVFALYASLLKSASIDREAVLGFVDTLGCRFDDIPQDPEAARAVAIHVAKRALGDARQLGVDEGEGAILDRIR